jgi:hypothetical protein
MLVCRAALRAILEPAGYLGARMFNHALGRHLTPEEEARVGNIIDQWLDQNVEVKTEEGQKMFRLKKPEEEQPK